jgi:hypothetical protein
MTKEKETEAVTREILAKSEAMINEAERLLQKSDDFYKDLGAERGLATDFLKSDRVSPEDRERFQKEMDQWEQEMETEIRKEQERFKMENRSGKIPPGIKKGRVMI